MAEETKPDEKLEDAYDFEDPDEGAGVAPKSEEKPAEKPGLPDELLQRAVSSGLSHDDVKDMDEPSLNRALGLLAKAKPAPKEGPKAEAKSEPPKDWDMPWEELVDKDGVTADDEEEAKWIGKKIGDIVHPSVKKIVNAMHLHYKEELSKRDQVLQQLWNDSQQRRAEEGMAKLDTFFAEVSESYPEYDFKPSKIKEGSPEYKRLSLTMRAMDTLADDYKQKGKPIPSNEDLRDEVIETFHGKREKGKSRPDAESRRPTPTAKPTQRNGTAPKGLTREQQGINNLHAKLVAKGIVGADDNDQIEDLKDSLLG